MSLKIECSESIHKLSAIQHYPLLAMIEAMPAKKKPTDKTIQGMIDCLLPYLERVGGDEAAVLIVEIQRLQACRQMKAVA